MPLDVSRRSPSATFEHHPDVDEEQCKSASGEVHADQMATTASAISNSGKRHERHQAERHHLKPVSLHQAGRAGKLVAAAFPGVKCIYNYNWRSSLMVDVVAGLTVACMAVPQSMSYAAIAGLPTVYGLYTHFMPTLAYAMCGSSRQLVIGPVAVLSLILSAGLSDIIPFVNSNPNEPEDLEAQHTYNTMAVQVSMIVSVVYLLMGLFRLGFLTDYISHTVVNGFTSAAAIIIGISQLKHMVGFPIRKSHNIIGPVLDLLANIEQLKWYEISMSMAALAILVLTKTAGARFSKLAWIKPLGPLVVTATSSFAVYLARLDVSPGVKVVGHIQAGPPLFTAPLLLPARDTMQALLPLAGTMSIVGLVESFSIAKMLAHKNQYEINPNQELWGLGMANLAGACFGAYPSTGSFSRSAVANDTGAKTCLASTVSALVVLLAILFITPLFERMPLNTLAAIVINGVAGLVDISEGFRLFRVRRLECLVWCTAFLSTLALGVELGLCVAVATDLTCAYWSGGGQMMECSSKDDDETRELDGATQLTSVATHKGPGAHKN